MSNLHKRIFSSKGLPPKPTGPSQIAKRLKSQKDFSPLPWDQYFETKIKVQKKGSDNKFNIYKSGSSGPIVLFLHGGGFSGLTWSLLSKCLQEVIECQCVAFDQRGHGETETTDDNLLSAEVLASDVEEVIDALTNDQEDQPKVVLIGHSMGGAIAVHAALRPGLQCVCALAVIDVVEGTALNALHAMKEILKNRPSSFKSIEYANEWCIRTGYIRNLDSARVSMAGQLVKISEKSTTSTNNEKVSEIQPASLNMISEEEEDEEANDLPSSSSNDLFKPPPLSSTTDNSGYTWRIDLNKTAPYWEGWFKDMSNIFLSVPVPKLLVLAGIDRLDATLARAQMQGKFQLQVFDKCGHAVHEDRPKKVADVLAHFIIRNQIGKQKGDFVKPFPAC